MNHFLYLVKRTAWPGIDPVTFRATGRHLVMEPSRLVSVEETFVV